MRALGGCSSMNAMIYIRGNHADYDGWRDAHGATGWGFEDVLPYFVRARGTPASAAASTGRTARCTSRTAPTTTSSARRFIEAGVAAGLKRNDDFNGAEQEGVGPTR